MIGGRAAAGSHKRKVVPIDSQQPKRREIHA
jgi:hypothetical protein